ncbi:MAG: hypothetical protein AAFY14_06535, partial [Pseudomonadota bacterium]
ASKILLAVVGKATYDFVRSPSARQEMIKEYREKPLTHFVLLTWLASILMFVLGLIIPDLGRVELFDSGWHIIEIGALGFFGIWFVGLFVDLNDLDKKQ